MSLAKHRPRNVGEIVDATFTFYRANFVTIVTVTMIVAVPPAIVKLAVPADFVRLVDFIGNLLIPIAQGAIALIVAATVERGETLDVGQAYRGTKGRKRSLIAVQIASGLLVGIGFILLIVPGLIALAWTAVCVPVVVIEQVGYSKAIDRSRALAAGRWMPVLGTLLLTWGLVLLLMIGTGFVIGTLNSGGPVVDLAVDLLAAFVLPIPAIAMALLYYDLRVRTESADLDAMISALPVSTPAPAP